MNGEPSNKPAEGKGILARFSPVQLAIAGLGVALVLVVLLVLSVLARTG